MDDHPVRYARTGDGVAIAWGEYGSGPPLFYQHSPMAGHFRHGPDDPDYGPYYHRLAEKHRLILHDNRGIGLSRPCDDAPSLDGYVADAVAVIEAAGIAPTDVFAQTSSGCWVAVELAVRRPDLVSRLVLFQPTCEDRDACLDLVEALRLGTANWEMFTENCIAQVQGWKLSEDAIRKKAARWRASDTLEHATAIAMWAATEDVTATLPRITQPTLAIRRQETTSYASGQATDAAVRLIPGAEYVMVPGSAFQPTLDHAEEIIAAAERFLGARQGVERTSAVPGTNGLSAREAEVLRLVAGGESNGRIAERLTLSPHTVNRHVSNIFAKTGVRNRAEATAWAVRRGIGD